MTPQDPKAASAVVADFLKPFLARSHARYAALLERFAPEMNDAPPTLRCERHEFDRPLNPEHTLAVSRDRDRFTPVYADCLTCLDCAVKARPWLIAGVPERIVAATLDNFETPDNMRVAALASARTFLARAVLHGGFMLLLGPTGTGKGHIAVGVTKELAMARDTKFVTHADLLAGLRETYDEGSTVLYVERLKKVEVLILDEFGVSGGGKDEAPLLYQILSARHDRRLVTIITSNETLKDIKAALGFRVMDRIREDFVLINFVGESWRSRKAEKL